MKKVIIISTSLRPGSNSHAMAEQFAKGAEAAGHQVEFVSLRGKEIKFCVGCLSCHAHLLLRDERPDEDPHRPNERDVSQGLQIPRCTSADDGC